MDRTSQFNLPFLQASQAQKHVTVNEALTLLDALAHISFASMTMSEPPVAPSEGAKYLVPDNATGDWQGYSNEIALFSNGGWEYLIAKEGWAAWVEDDQCYCRFINDSWQVVEDWNTSTTAKSENFIVEFDHQVTQGGTNITTTQIPSHSSVIGVSARVKTALTGDVTSWDLGVANSHNRYGSGYGIEHNSYALGMTGQPQTYYQDTPIVLTANGGDFDEGLVRIAIHCMKLSPPS